MAIIALTALPIAAQQWGTSSAGGGSGGAAGGASGGAAGGAAGAGAAQLLVPVLQQALSA